MDYESDARAQLQRLLRFARTQLGMDVAWISRFSADEQVIRLADGALDQMRVVLGEGRPLAGSFCSRVVAGTLPPLVPDARRHPVSRDLDVTAEMGIGSYVGVPWRDADGRTAGMLCCVSRSPAPALGDRAVDFLGLLAEVVSGHLNHTTALGPAHAGTRDLVALDVRMVFQPVVRLAPDTVVAYEALARFDDPRFPTPAHAFAEASHAGLGAELEHLAVRRALEHLDTMPDGTWLGVNLSAEAVLTTEIQATLLRQAHRRIGIELTEHTQVGDYGRLVTATDRLRDAGIQLAIDDAGAGYASLRHILQLRPDVIKLDIDLIRQVHADPVRQALTRSLVSFAADIGASLIAEGIETRQERDALLELGVTFGQGYFLGGPGTLPSRGLDSDSGALALFRPELR
ncbi:EAL domain-containing protein [Dactylosporangium sp. NPDC000244]|uniref:sensor domain-containing phosphodiesterase n=1 Tax=Dactylosporangium sp. NPDC000244 TaxID=3154365 RepID=UPI00331DED10